MNAEVENVEEVLKQTIIATLATLSEFKYKCTKVSRGKCQHCGGNINVYVFKTKAKKGIFGKALEIGFCRCGYGNLRTEDPLKAATFFEVLGDKLGFERGG